MLGEDALDRIRAFVASDAAPDSPLRTMAESYLSSGSQYGPLEDRLTLSVLCDAMREMHRRISALERDED